MENVHRSSSRNWISDEISVRQFRDEWCANLPSAQNNYFSFQTSVLTELEEVEKACGLPVMKCQFQNKMEISKELEIPEGVELDTLRLQKEELEKRKKDAQYDSLVYCNSKFLNYPRHKMPDCQEPPDDVEYQYVKEPEVLLYIQIFRPEQKTSNFKRASVQRFPVFQVDQEFMVLGSQCLAELRDKIDCVSDRAIPDDYSDRPEYPPEMTCKDLYKSGYFYINGVFYNDMRHPDCRDYSQIIIDWSETKGRGIGPFKKMRMEETKFIDLTIQLGYPYVYVHQGNCEHMLVFSDLLMYTHNYSNNRSDYPIHLSLKPKKRVFCMVCHVHTAEWITFGNKRLPENPFFFCKQCFFSFNYDEHDQKIGNFRAYHHIDRSVIL